MTIKLIKWSNEKNEYIYVPAEDAIGVAFVIAPGNIVEIGIDVADEKLVVRSIHGRLVITMDVANRFGLGVDK